MDVQKSVQDIFNNHHKSVVLIRRGKHSSGTGFIIGKTNSTYLVMTCYHVIADNKYSDPSSDLKVRLSRDTKEYGAETLYTYVLSDLGIIKVNEVSGEREILQFGDVEDLAPNTDIVQLGYINGYSSTFNLDPSVCPGSIAAPLQDDESGNQDIVYSGSSIHGASGSAVMFGNKVIGVHYAMSDGLFLYARSSHTVNITLKYWLQISREVPETTEKMIEMMVQKLQPSELGVEIERDLNPVN
uniref:Serine protease n=1 Tax=Leersia perrieri TaxID=77586 RepID=A0A0D9XYJ8_9ORYZ